MITIAAMTVGDLRLVCGLILAFFLEKQLLGSTATCQSEFPLMLQLRQSTFGKDGWGLIYAYKTREAHQVLLAGGCAMKKLHVTKRS